MRKNKTYTMILCALFAALIVIGAYIKIPVPGVPITLQFFFTMLAGLILGGKVGAFSVLIYIFLGLSGLPVFSGGGGVSYILTPSFGYIIGFVIATYITGTIANKSPSPGYKRLFIANFTGWIILSLLGMSYYYLIGTFYLEKEIAIKTMFTVCFLQTLPGDIVKCILAAIIAKRLIPIVKNRNLE